MLNATLRERLAEILRRTEHASELSPWRRRPQIRREAWLCKAEKFMEIATLTGICVTLADNEQSP